MLVMGSKALEEGQPRSPVAGVPACVDNSLSKTTGPLLCWLLWTISCTIAVTLEFIYFAIKIIATTWASCPMGVWVIPHVPRITGAGPASHRRCHVHPVTSPDWTVLYHGIVNMDGLMLSLYIRHHLAIGWLRSTISCSWNQKTTCQQIH